MTYRSRTRTVRYSLTLALPLLLLYEAMAAALPMAATGGLRNAADVMLKSAAYAIAGGWGPIALGAVLVGGAIWAIIRDVRRSRDVPKARLLGLMLVESAALSVVFGIVVGVVTAQLLGAAGLLGAISAPEFAPSGAVLQVNEPFAIERLSLGTRIMLSLGAGIYEEIVFRVLLVGSIAVAARSLLGWGRTAAGVTAVIVGALIFSAFHYVGPYGDPLELHSFTFRFIGGVAFSALYLLRGFGITAWTHALYDVLVLVF